jgi:nitroreductase/NAD-dependent dihydropyrimidine dehydrogenase PreA subunit
MSWVSIDYDKCSICGTCIEGCGRCFHMTGDCVTVYADQNCCSVCGRCVALCPTGAITHSEMNMENFPEIEKKEFLAADDFTGFLRQRRSHRAFIDKDIPESDIGKLVDIVRYCPTGSNSQMVELLVIRDPEKKKKLSDLTVDFMIKTGSDSAKMVETLKAEGKTGPDEIGQMEMMSLYGDMLKQSREMGMDPIFYNAPAVMVFHAKDTGFSKKDDCVIASTTMGLLSRTMGLEFTYIGLFEGAANGYPAVMEDLGLPKGNKVFSVIIIGYPKMKFLRMVDRKPTSVTYA